MSLKTNETIIWYGFFRSDGVGKTGLADVIIYIYKDKNAAPEVNGLACTELAGGFYYYEQASPTAGFRVAKMKTADTTVDSKEIGCIHLVGKGGCDYLDASIAANAPAQQWGYSTRTLTSFGTLIADIWGYTTRTLTSLSAVASDIWSYITRKLTSAVTDEEIPVDMAATGGGIIAQIGYAASISGTQDIFLVEGDTKPYLPFTLLDSDGEPINLSGATIKFRMIQVEEDTLQVDDDCTLTNEAEGEYEYRWAAGDLDTPGDFNAETEITFADGKVQIWPPNAPFKIHIRAKLKSVT